MFRRVSDPLIRKKRRVRRLYFYGGLAIAFIGFYLWQPWEFDFIPRALPNPNPLIDPDSKRLFARGTRISIVTAHPDDSEFYMGGLLTKLHKSGAIVSQVICTDGDKGFYPFEDYLANRKVRRSEALQAARTWGGIDLVFLGFPDGRLRNNEATRAAALKELQRQRPEIVLTFDGDYPPRFSHQDHRRSGEIVQSIVTLVPTAKWLMRFSTQAPNYIVDITDEWEDQKKLVAIHESQFYGERLARVLNMIGSRAEDEGNLSGVGLGEGLRCSPVR